MAKDWNDAQRKERAFWDRIYVAKQRDIDTYSPIDTATAIDFTTKTLGRHGLTLAALDGKTVADIGCGPYGVLYGIMKSREQFAKPPMLIGVDPLMDFYDSNIALLKRGEGVELHQGKAEALPVTDSSCDFVFCVNSLDHMEEPAQAVRELHRITRAGGVCAVSLHTVTRPFSPAHRVLKYIDTNHPHHFTVGRVRELLSKYFTKADVTYIATMTEDQPEFGFRYIFRSSNKPVAFARWISTFVLQSVYFTCQK